MVIHNNIPALQAYNNMNKHVKVMSKCMQRMSSGLRINSAADDAAGLGISEKMRGQIRGLRMASQNAQNGISLLQTAEGALSETHAIVQRMRELAVQSSNGTYTELDRDALSKEYEALKDEVSRIGSYTNYNGIKLLDGSAGGKKDYEGIKELGIDNGAITATGGVSGIAKLGITKNDDDSFGAFLRIGDEKVASTIEAGDDKVEFELEDNKKITVAVDTDKLKEGVITNLSIKNDVVDAKAALSATEKSKLYLQVGANGADDSKIGIHLDSMSAENLGDVKGGKTLENSSIATREQANEAIEIATKSINLISSQRATIGANINRLEHTINNLNTQAENLAAAESSIRDADMAEEMMEYTKHQILLQAAQSMLAQANRRPEQILQLLQ